MRNLHIALFALLFAFVATAHAQQSERFGPYELHYSVLNSTFITPEVASQYGLTRGKKKGLINLAVREHVEVGTEGRPMLLKAKTWDLTQRTDFLEFKEVREGDAIYYIAQFDFINEEWRFFEVYFRPEGGNETYTFKFKHQLYVH